MKYTLVLILGFFIASCVTEKQRLKICKNCPVRDSIIVKETIVKKDTTIYLTQLVTEPIYLENPCALLCDSFGKLKPFYLKEKKNGITKVVSTENGSLKIDCKADSLELVLKGLITERSKVSETHSTRIIENFRTTQWQDFLLVSSYIFWALLIAYLIYRGIKLWLKMYKPF